jgi:hypothetical protein
VRAQIKIKRASQWIALMALIMVTLSVVGWQGVARAEQVPVSSVERLVARHLPANTLAFAHIDLKALRGTKLYQMVRATFDAPGAAQQMLAVGNTLAGFDILEGLDALTLQFREEDGARDDRFLITVSGPKVAEASLLEAMNAQLGGKLKPVEGKAGRYAATSGAGEALAISGDDALIGDLEELNAALDTPTTDPAWAALVREASASATGFVVFNTAATNAAEFGGLKTLQIQVKAGDDLRIKAIAAFEDEAQAEVMRAEIVKVQAAVEAEVKGTGLADAQVKRDGVVLRVELALSEAQLNTLYEQLLTLR